MDFEDCQSIFSNKLSHIHIFNASDLSLIIFMIDIHVIIFNC